MKRRNYGFTLAELMTAVVLFLLFGTSLTAMLIMGMDYWQQASLTTETQEGARSAADWIATELRQAIPDPDPGQAGHPPTGYRSISPAVEPTGVLTPNANETEADSLLFTKPNAANYDPVQVGWNSASPANYQQVEYEVQAGDRLMRTVRTYDESGRLADSRSDTLTSLTGGSVALTVTRLSNSLYRLNLACAKEGKSFSVDARVYVESP